MSEVEISRPAPRGMITLRADLAACAGPISGATGVSIPGQRQVVGQGAVHMAWMAPDELLVMTPLEQTSGMVDVLNQALSAEHHLVADVSDARALFRIAGPGAREVLAKGAPVDLKPTAFAPGQIRRTRLGQVAAAFWMPQENVFDLVCFRSVAEYVEAFLTNAARPGSLPGHLPR